MGEEKNRYTLIQHVEESLFTWVTSWYIGPLKSSTWVEYLRVAESTPNGVDSLRTDESLAAPEWKLDRILLCRFVGSLGFRNPDVRTAHVFSRTCFVRSAVRLDPSILCVFCILGLLHAAVVDVARVLLWCWWCWWFDGLVASQGGAVVCSTERQHPDGDKSSKKANSVLIL